MKIDWKSKNTKITIICIAIVIVPILFNQSKSLITGLITAYKMSQPKLVYVDKPLEKEIYPEFETTGRIESRNSINIIARINGWLQESYFHEGDTVKKGQKLFLIEPEEYLYSARNAQARVNENRAVYKNSQIELNRAQELVKQDLVSREYYDNALAKRNQDRAALDGSIAQLSKAKLDLSYTNIVAPMTGRIGKLLISKGNYVTASSGTIATIYTTDVMRANFQLKSSEYIMLKKYKMTSSKDEKLPVEVRLRLADGTIYDKVGRIEFSDNKVDETTGSVTFRAEFDNPNEILIPGDYVNIILKVKKPTKVMLIPQSATKTDVGTGYYVWVVKDNKAEKRDIEVAENIDNNWVVKKGLDYNDTIVVQGIQDIYKTGQKINPKQYNKEVKNESKEK